MNPYKVNDIISSSWGYDQTNIDFFKVIAVKKSMIEIRQLNSHTVEDRPASMTGVTTPLDEFHPNFPEVHRKKPKPDGSFKLETWGRWCRPWDGKPKHCSWYA